MLDFLNAGNISAVRDHTSEIIEDAFDSTEPALIEAPPSSGKTTSMYDLAIESETPVTYLCARTDLYDEAEDHFDNKISLLSGIQFSIDSLSLRITTKFIRACIERDSLVSVPQSEDDSAFSAPLLRRWVDQTTSLWANLR